jgi:hypothetical protein
MESGMYKFCASVPAIKLKIAMAVKSKFFVFMVWGLGMYLIFYQILFVIQ